MQRNATGRTYPPQKYKEFPVKLTIEISGYKNEVVISAVPRAFLTRVVRHCYGKNNTPYFAHNCFKGVLYFDEELARKFAKSVGYDWNGWWEERSFHHRAAYVFEDSLRIQVNVGPEPQTIYPSQISRSETPIAMSHFLPKIKADEVLMIMGSVDKGTMHYHLDDFDGEFDPAKLALAMESFADFGLDDRQITGLTYDGKPLIPGHDDSKGKRMIVPAMFSGNGDEVELDDLVVGEIFES